MEQITYKICDLCRKEFQGMAWEIVIQGEELARVDSCRACAKETEEFLRNKKVEK